MIFVPQKAVKGQALADFLAAHPSSESTRIDEEIPDEVANSNVDSHDTVWQMFFDGASIMGPKGNIVAGVGVVLISPSGLVINRAYSFTESCSNNGLPYDSLYSSFL
ncbi:uncharacterized protein M6B38_361375 [Iris pallida]|uniref:Uncharacterized protein n=1 Tax=Iris pallida TaxID=29817 RepID=A0AAX6GJD8_IRIPA|nr:uncharacterized protein M6B38_361375 [Iris pallida]